ncbi:MAG: hypothetical protein ACRC8Y_24325, partial [Chroococcales cyanobacterium]
LLPLLGFSSMLAATAIYLYNQQQKLRKCFPLKGDMKECSVMYMSRDMMRIPVIFGTVLMGTAKLQYSRDRALCVISLPGGQFHPVEFDRTGSVALLTPKSRMMGLPCAIRLFHNNQTYYLIAARDATRNGGNSQKTKQLFADLQLIFPSEQIEVELPQRCKTVLGVVLFLALGTIATAMYAGIRSALLQGPSLVATTDASDVFTTTSRYLYQLDSEGNFQNKYARNSLGIADDITALHPINAQELMIGDWKTGTIKRCHLKENRCETLPGLKRDADQLVPFRRSFKFVVSPKHQLIYVTDTSNHRLVVLDLQGREIESTRGEGVLLCYPNGAILTNAGQLAIADTNNLRVLTWSTDAVGRNLKPDRSIDMVQSPKPEIRCVPNDKPRNKTSWFPSIMGVVNSQLELREYEIASEPIALPVAHSDRIFPTFIQQDYRGFWWVVLENGRLQKQDLLQFDPDWNNPIRVDLPPDREISHIAIGPQRLIVADSDRYQLFSVSLTDLTVEEFGNGEFQRLMRREKLSQLYLKQGYRWLINSLLMFLCMIPVLVSWNKQQFFIEMARLDPTVE